MKKIFVIARRELTGYARSPLGSLVIAATLLGVGLYFYWDGLSQKLLSAEVLRRFFYTASGGTMIAGLVLSMRLLAEERQTGTLTLLNTAPIRGVEVVLGKFLAAMVVLVLLQVLTLYMPLMIFVNGKVSLGHIAVGYLGLVLLGSATIAVGLFASSVARSQVIAAILGAGILIPLLMLWMVAKAVEPPLNGFLAAMAFHHENFLPFTQGTLRLQGVAYYTAVTYLFILGATRSLEARRWR